MNQEQSTETPGGPVGEIVFDLDAPPGVMFGINPKYLIQNPPKPNLLALTDLIHTEFQTPTRRSAERIAQLIYDNFDRIKGYVE